MHYICIYIKFVSQDNDLGRKVRWVVSDLIAIRSTGICGECDWVRCDRISVLYYAKKRKRLKKERKIMIDLEEVMKVVCFRLLNIRLSGSRRY